MGSLLETVDKKVTEFVKTNPTFKSTCQVRTATGTASAARRAAANRALAPGSRGRAPHPPPP